MIHMSEFHEASDDGEQMTDDDNIPVLDDVRDNQRSFTFSWRHALVVPAIVGYYLALGMVMYIIPEYIHERIDQDYVASETDTVLHNSTYNICHGNKSGPGYERYKYVQQETAKWQNYLSVARVTPGIFATLILASYSDMIGRKVLLVACMSGFAVKLLALTLLVHFRAHLVFLIIGEVIEGVTGSFTTFLAVLFGIVADLTDTGRQRTIAIVLSELLLGIVITISSFTTGYYIKYVGFFAPALTALGCTLATVCATILVLPETLRERKQGGIRNLFSGISTAFKLYFKPESKIVQIKYFLLLFAFIFYTIQVLNRGSLETLYQLGKPFCWSATKIGWFGAARMGMLSLVGMGGVFILKKFLADDSIAVLSCAFTVVSYIVEGFAQTESVIFTVPVLATLSVMPIPMIRSLMSQLTPAEKQGAMFSTIGAFETLCSMIGTLTGNLVYSATLSVMNGFVFLILGAITAISGAILGVFMCVQRCHDDLKDGDIQAKEMPRDKA